MSPTVKKGSERVRVCLHAGNTFEEIEGLVQCVKEWIEVMEKRVRGQVDETLVTFSPPISSSTVDVQGINSADIGASFKGKTPTERAKL